MPIRIFFCALLLLLSACSSSEMDTSFGPCADLGILDPDELDLERNPLWEVSDIEAARRLPPSVKALRLVGATDQLLSELDGLAALEEVVFVNSPALTFSGIEELQNHASLEILDVSGLNLADSWMDELALIPSLRELYLGAQPNLTQIGMTDLRDFTSLEELYLEGFDLDQQWVDELAEIPNLRRLSLKGISGLNENAAIEIASIASLKRLDLTDCGITNDWLMRLGAAQGQQLEELVLVGNPLLTHHGVAYLEGIPSLLELNISGLAPNAAWFPEIAKLTSLVELRLNQIPPVDPQFWEELKALTNLETLEVAGSQIGDDQLVHIAELPKLRKLDLSVNPFTETGMARLRACDTLVQLFLDGNYGLTDTALAYISQITSIRELRLGSGGEGSYSFGNQGMRRISEMPALQDLTLARCNGITDGDMELLKRLAPTLRRLTLYRCDTISGVFITYLASAKSCLKRLTILDCLGIFPDQMLEIDRLQNLERLVIPSEGNDDLARLVATIEGIKRFTANSASFTNEGLRRFDSHPNLEVLTIAGTQISDNDIAEFHAESDAIVIR